MRACFTIFKALITAVLLVLIIDITLIYLPGLNLFRHQDSPPGEPEKSRQEDKADSGVNNARNSGAQPGNPDVKSQPAREDTSRDQRQTISGVNQGEKLQSSNTKEERSMQDYFIAPEELPRIEHIRWIDKLAAFSIIRKISRSDLDSILCMAQGGVTYDEKEEAEKVLAKSLSQNEINKLNQILIKSKSEK